MIEISTENRISTASAIGGSPARQRSRSCNVALIYMPWGSISRVSLGVGILKQCVHARGHHADIHYFNIKFAELIGPILYEQISGSAAFFPEWFFAVSLFGANGMRLLDNDWDGLQQTPLGLRMAEKVKASLNGDDSLCRRISEEIVPGFIAQCINEVDWSLYDVIGFSCTFAQTLSSVLLAKRIKEGWPHVKVVFGGANADSEMGVELLRGFDWIDYVVHGEAEMSFPMLLDNIAAGEPLKPIPGVSSRTPDGVLESHSDAQPLADLNQSPTPDYSDYFKEFARAGFDRSMPINLSFESSRGCWWGAKHHCTFCGLNGLTMAYRKKSPERVYSEIMEIASKYRCLTLNAVDNILAPEYYSQLLPRLTESDIDLKIFYEIKANVSREQIRALKMAGITKIQPGIESMNSRLLKLMRKGITAIQNIQLLKWCQEYGIEASWNLLYGFPGETLEDYKDLPGVLKQLFHFRPPTGVNAVVFERFSPYHFDREKYSLKLKALPYYSFLYPSSLVSHEKLAYYFQGEWEKTGDPDEYIKPVAAVTEEWQDHWKSQDIFCFYEKGPDFISIYDNRPLGQGSSSAVRKIHLSELQARVYLFCDQNRSFAAILEMLENAVPKRFKDDQLQFLLDQFVQQGLMFREENRYIALATRGNHQQAASANLPLSVHTGN